MSEVDTNPNAIGDEDGTERAMLESKYGQVWNTRQLQTDFSVISFLAPYCMVEQKSNNVRGTIQFQHWPRYYFNFVPE